MARQRLGQHFLASEAWQERIASFLPRDAEAVWVEIGAGHGEMTSLLAERSCRVIAIETDSALAATLRERFASSPQVEIIEADVLTVNFAALIQNGDPRSTHLLTERHSELPPVQSERSEESAIRESKNEKADPSSRSLLGMTTKGLTARQDAALEDSPIDQGSSLDKTAHGASGVLTSGREDESGAQSPQNQRLRVYGNLPYYITSPILSHLFRFTDEITSIHIVVQLEVAERIAAQPRRRDYGYLSALCQYFTEPELALKIPAGAFRPPPKVSSALVNMHIPGARAKLKFNAEGEAQFLKFLQLAFAHKRKTLRNNLRGAFSERAITEALRSCGLGANARAEEIALPKFAQVFRTFYS